MSRAVRRQAPVVLTAVVVAVVALGGTVYAAGKINGHAIKVKSLPGNRLALRSLPGNRLKPGSIGGNALAPGTVGREQLAPGSVTGVQIDLSSLGPVPAAAHADSADFARSAKDAETALNAASAQNARTLDGYEAGCGAGTRFFAGACWQNVADGTAISPAAAAESCASQGGALPDALALAAFANEPNVAIAAGEEWSGDLTNLSGLNSYSVVTVTPLGEINFSGSNTNKRFRCVLPLVS